MSTEKDAVEDRLRMGIRGQCYVAAKSMQVRQLLPVNAGFVFT